MTLGPARCRHLPCKASVHVHSHGKQRRSPLRTSRYLSRGNSCELAVRARSTFPVLLQQEHVCPPLLSLTSPAKPRFSTKGLSKPYRRTLLRGQPSTCSVPYESGLHICSHLSVAFVAGVNSNQTSGHRTSVYMTFEAQTFLRNKGT